MFWKKKSVDNSNQRIEEFFLHKGYTKMGNFSEKDVFIAGFPKSGNTWMQHLMAGINYSVDMSHISNMLVRDLVPDVHQGMFYKRYNERMVFKTHFLPQEEYRNAIFLVRDPRDAINSFFQMQRGRGVHTTIAEIVKEKKGLFTSWNEHVEAWSANPFKAKCIFVKYEDLVDNTMAELNKINSFFNFDIQHDFLQGIVSNCTFSKMREKESSALWGKGKDWKEGKFFIRKGVKGSYKEDIPVEDIKLIEDACSHLIKKLNY